jgi:hypothetical protein
MSDDNDDDRGVRTRKPDRCLQCRYPITWAAQRQQFGRLMRAGFSIAGAKQMMPRCQKCMTVALRTVTPRHSTS